MEKLDPIDNPIREEIREERQEIKSKGLTSEMDVPRGHSVFTYNKTTAEVLPAKFKGERTLDMSRVSSGTDGAIIEGVVSIGKISEDPNLIYFTALNLKNAIRKSVDIDAFYKYLAEQEKQKQNRDKL